MQGDPHPASWEGIRQVCRRTSGAWALHEEGRLLPVQTGKVPTCGGGCGWSGFNACVKHIWQIT